jgi:hypothetical protein
MSGGWTDTLAPGLRQWLGAGVMSPGLSIPRVSRNTRHPRAPGSRQLNYTLVVSRNTRTGHQGICIHHIAKPLAIPWSKCPTASFIDILLISRYVTHFSSQYTQDFWRYIDYRVTSVGWPVGYRVWYGMVWYGMVWYGYRKTYNVKVLENHTKKPKM